MVFFRHALDYRVRVLGSVFVLISIDNVQSGGPYVKKNMKKK